jgi:hypothetical protein
VPLEKYQSGNLDYVYVVPKIETEQSLADVLKFVASDSSKTKLALENGEQISYIPVNKVRLETPGKENIHVELKKRAVTKGDLAFWDIISSNQGKRPVCFTSWTDPEEHGLQKNLIQSGLVYELTDVQSDTNSVLNMGKIDSENLYAKLMQTCDWNNLEDSTVYFDWHHRRMFATLQIRSVFYRLALKLTEENKPQKALNVVHKAEKIMPLSNWPVDYQSILMTGLYSRNNNVEEGIRQIRTLAKSLEEWLNFYVEFPSKQKKLIYNEAGYHLSLYHELIKQAENTLPEPEINAMQNMLVAFAGKLE